LGEDREKFDFIRSAAADLAEKLRQNRSILINGSSVLLGGEVGEKEPAFELCKEAITTH
jgi:hypothetical protein